LAFASSKTIEGAKNMSRLSGKVAVVTGASKGIGAGIAKGLAAEGASVVVNYSSSREGADRVVADIKNQGGKAMAVQGNVAKSADVQRIFAETQEVARFTPSADHPGPELRILKVTRP
jgi:NAD(P)-dependent dehydrogenase (short-subunit alcohol dehydrogenase family)